MVHLWFYCALMLERLCRQDLKDTHGYCSPRQLDSSEPTDKLKHFCKEPH